MNQDAMLELLSRSLDEPLSEAERHQLDEALAGSASLRAMARDFAALKAAAASPVPAPPAPAPQLIARVQAGKARLRRWSYGLALVAAACALFLILPKQRPLTQPDQEADWARAQVLAAETQARYHRDLAQMEVLATQKLVVLPPGQARSFAQQWANLDKLMRYCEQNARKAMVPENYQGLAEVYQAKVQLFDAILAS